MQTNKSLNRSGGWARNLNSKVAGRRPVSFGVNWQPVTIMFERRCSADGRQRVSFAERPVLMLNHRVSICRVQCGRRFSFCKFEIDSVFTLNAAVASRSLCNSRAHCFDPCPISEQQHRQSTSIGMIAAFGVSRVLRHPELPDSQDNTTRASIQTTAAYTDSWQGIVTYGNAAIAS